MNSITSQFRLLLLSAVLFSPVFMKADEAWKLDGKTREKCLEVLRAGFRDDDFWPAMHAAEALTLAGQGGEVRSVLEPKLTTETDDQMRCGLARELVRAGDRKKADILFSILKGDDPHGHVHAAESLYKVGFDTDPKPLQQRFETTEDIRLKLMAAAALAKHGRDPVRSEAFAFLRKVLATEPDPDTFRLSAWVLGRIGDPSDIPRIRARLDDAKEPIQKSFLRNALAALGDIEARQAVLKNLESKDPDIRTYAAIFAGEAGIFEAATLLTNQLSDEDLDARIRAAQGLIVLSQ
jgi:sialidase-1